MLTCVRVNEGDGASQLLMNFWERLRPQRLLDVFFLAASGFQMFIWAKLYSLGYEGVGDLLTQFRTIENWPFYNCEEPTEYIKGTYKTER
jgi:hypothetical protein